MSYHIAFRSYDATMSMFTFLPLWSLDALIPWSPWRPLWALWTKRSWMTLRLDRYERRVYYWNDATHTFLQTYQSFFLVI